MDDDVVLVRIDNRGFIHMIANGVLNDAIASECSRHVRSTPEFQAGMPLLLDLSHTTSIKLTTDHVVSLAQAAQRDQNRVAFLAPDATGYGLARMYEMIADTSDGRVAVFREMSQALSWLGL